jgi:plastocyanin
VPNFSISIVSEDPAFSPETQNVPANSVVTWNNTTEEDHKLALSDGRVTDLIYAEQSSDEYVIAASITYTCTEHEDEGTGSINVVAVEDIPPC